MAGKINKKKILKETADGVRMAMEMPGVEEWGNAVLKWKRENPIESNSMGEELASARRVFKGIIERIVMSHGFPMPPEEPGDLLLGFCSTYGPLFDDGFDVSEEVGAATMERFAEAVEIGKKKVP